MSKSVIKRINSQLKGSCKYKKMWTIIKVLINNQMYNNTANLILKNMLKLEDEYKDDN